jgi:hypothetical protein
MNGEQRRIEIFTPFGEAFELMKRILFRPFDFTKWLVLGFAAFIGGNWGGGFSFGNFDANAFKHTGHRSAISSHFFRFSHFGVWGWIGVAAFVTLMIALFLVLTWVICRGRFVFTDCVVKNRAAIVQPWHEFRREGNNFFLFTLVVFFGTVLVVGALVLIVMVPLGIFNHAGAHAGSKLTMAIAITCVCLLWFIFAIFLAIVTHFMIPVMYRQRCRAGEAFVQVAKLIMSHLGSFILLILFSIVLFLAFVVISTVVACATCCIGALPYVSSVLLLPVLVCLAAFKLYFLRQFGNDYDVWNGPSPLETAAPPPLPPSAPLAA